MKRTAMALMGGIVMIDDSSSLALKRHFPILCICTTSACIAERAIPEGNETYIEMVLTQKN